MPQLRSFTGFAGTPGIGAAYVGGAGVGQRAQEAQMQDATARAAIGQRASESSQQAETSRAQIANQYAMAEMENATRQRALQMQALKDAQELEVQKAYQTAVIGIKDREAQVAAAKQQHEFEQAAAETASRLAMQRQVEELMAGGEKPTDAFRRGMISHGPTANLPGTAWSDVLDPGKAAMIPGDIGQVDRAQGDLGERGYQTFRAGPNSLQLVPPPTTRAPAEVPGDPSKYSFGASLHDKPAEREAQDLEKKRNKLEEKLDSAEFSADRQRLKDYQDNPKKKFSPQQMDAINTFKKKLAQLAKYDEDIARLRSGLTNSIVPNNLSESTKGTNRTSRFKIIKSE